MKRGLRIFSPCFLIERSKRPADAVHAAGLTDQKSDSVSEMIEWWNGTERTEQGGEERMLVIEMLPRVKKRD